MPIKVYKPTSPARRHTSVVVRADLSRKKPEKSLLISKKRISGRNNSGKITVRHRGGGHKRLYRFVDFKRSDFFNQIAKVEAIEYDPNRTAYLALLRYPNQKKSYILCPQGLKVGDEIVSSFEKVEFKIGNRMPLEYIPQGSFIHDLELVSGRGGKLVRSAGGSAILQTVEGDFAQIKMPSGEVRLIKKNCLATIGQVSNIDHGLVRIGKAGRKRHMGFRPSVTGKSMNPVDHPHGGGEGHQPIGMKGPKTPWGKPALGVRTRGKKWSDVLILKRRK